MIRPRLNGLGHISTPLAAIRIAGSTQLVVRPIAAIATDVVGIGLATLAYFSSSKWYWKTAAAVGGGYMATALLVEFFKLAAGPEAEV